MNFFIVAEKKLFIIWDELIAITICFISFCDKQATLLFFVRKRKMREKIYLSNFGLLNFSFYSFLPAISFLSLSISLTLQAVGEFWDIIKEVCL
jgi:hypothetical protein